MHELQLKRWRKKYAPKEKEIEKRGENVKAKMKEIKESAEGKETASKIKEHRKEIKQLRE